MEKIINFFKRLSKSNFISLMAVGMLAASVEQFKL